MIYWWILSYLSFVLAAIALAVMESVAHYPSRHILRDIWGGWWIRDWRSKYYDCNKIGHGEEECGRIKFNLFGLWITAPQALTSGWHFSRALMVISLAVSVATTTLIELPLVEGAIYLVILYATWNLVVYLLYNIALKQ